MKQVRSRANSSIDRSLSSHYRVAVIILADRGRGRSEDFPISDPLHPPSRRSLLGALSALPLMGSEPAQSSRTRSTSESAPGISGVRPEDFGARGDGIADDAPALQRAMDSIVERRAGGVILLQPEVAYRCDTGLVLDASYVSVWGQGLLDFSACTGSCLRVTASSVERSASSHNYGHKSMISGAIRVRGGGKEKTRVGIDFDTEHAGTAAQMLIENLSVSECAIGIRFARRAYNNVLLRCELHQCGTCVDWREADDNAERNTLVGCILFNSDTAVHLSHPAGALNLLSCSIDYTRRMYDVDRGLIFATDCHHESRLWSDRPVRCAGDGGFIRLTGGVMLNQAPVMDVEFLFDVAAGAAVRLDGVFMHNIRTRASKRSGAPALATGSGTFHAGRCESYNESPLPARLHESRTSLADPDFSAAKWQDPVWRLADTALPIISRHGGPGDNLQLERVARNGVTALLARKAYGSTSPAGFALLALPVCFGEQILAGFRVRRDPQRPGSNGTLLISPSWARMDGQGPGGVPILTKLESTGMLRMTPPLEWTPPVSPMATRQNRQAPAWATHFIMHIDMVEAHQASFLFRELWCDKM